MSGGRPLKRKSLSDWVDDLTGRMEQVERRYEPRYGQYEIKVFADRGALDGNLPDSAIIISPGDDKFEWPIPEELDGCVLLNAQAGVSVVSSAGDIVVSLTNLTAAVLMLTDPITIDAGDFNSYTSAAPSVVNQANALVATGDRIGINVVSEGTDAEGLAVIATFIEQL